MAVPFDKFDPSTILVVEEGKNAKFRNATIALAPMKLFNLKKFLGEGNGGMINTYDESYTKKMRYQAEREFGLTTGAKSELDAASAATLTRDQWKSFSVVHDALVKGARALFDARPSDWRVSIDATVDAEKDVERRIHKTDYVSELDALREQRRGTKTADEYEASLSSTESRRLHAEAFDIFLARPDQAALKKKIYDAAFGEFFKMFTWSSVDPALYDQTTGNLLPKSPLTDAKNRKHPKTYALYNRMHAFGQIEGLDYIEVDAKKTSLYKDLPAKPENYARVLVELERDNMEPKFPEWIDLDGKQIAHITRTFTSKMPSGEVVTRVAKDPYWLPYKGMDLYVSFAVTLEPHINKKNPSQRGIQLIFSPVWRIAHVESRPMSAPAPAYAGLKRAVPLEVSAASGIAGASAVEDDDDTTTTNNDGGGGGEGHDDKRGRHD